MEQLLSFRNLNLTFGNKQIFKDASLTISKGDRIGLIGLNGQGKSTLFNIIQEKIVPDTSYPPFTLDKTNSELKIFCIPQELNQDQFKDLKTEDYYLAFYPQLRKIYELQQKNYTSQRFEEFERLKGYEIQNSYLSYLKRFDFDSYSEDFSNLSGGEKRKIALSIGLSSPANFLLWDEPTNHLDIETIEKFEDELLARPHATYFIISHDRYLLDHVTNKIVHIENGYITSFDGTYLKYLDYLEEKEAELAKNLDKLENHHRRELAWMRQGIKARGTRSKKRVESFNQIKSQIKDFKEKKRKQIDLNLSHSGRKTKKLIEIQDGHFSYPNKELLTDLNLLITKKDKIALIGSNGSGKSSLIKLFSGELELTRGKLKRADGLKITVFDQHRKSLDEEKTPLQVVSDENDFVLLPDGKRLHVNSYLEKFLFNSDQTRRPISTLSGGEKNRLQLAIFLKNSADIWIFDEPTNDLDIETIEILERELKAYKDAVIIIGHDRAFLDNTCTQTWLINDKSIEQFTGGYTQVAPYLHALEKAKESEKSRIKDANKIDPQDEKIVANKDNASQSKMTYQEKQRFKVIEKEILSAEMELELAEKKLANFDFGDMNPEKQAEYESLNKNKVEKETKLEELYEEWEYLETKKA